MPPRSRRAAPRRPAPAAASAPEPSEPPSSIAASKDPSAPDVSSPRALLAVEIRGLGSTACVEDILDQPYRLENIRSAHPSLEIAGVRFTGEWEEQFGTEIFLRNAPLKGSDMDAAGIEVDEEILGAATRRLIFTPEADADVSALLPSTQVQSQSQPPAND
mmetsp:Transcript_1724/g.4638  ORF Transcript_1724/g.4638 Transcript_1724/m.4638 type:complete len:161 (-) Transcript_1724:275-757(-)